MKIIQCFLFKSRSRTPSFIVHSCKSKTVMFPYTGQHENMRVCVSRPLYSYWHPSYEIAKYEQKQVLYIKTTAIFVNDYLNWICLFCFVLYFHSFKNVYLLWMYVEVDIEIYLLIPFKMICLRSIKNCGDDVIQATNNQIYINRKTLRFQHKWEGEITRQNCVPCISIICFYFTRR